MPVIPRGYRVNPLNSQDLIFTNSLYCLPYSSCDVSLGLLCPYVLILHCRSWMPYNITVHFTGSSFNVLYHVINLFLYQVSKLQKCVSTSFAIYSLLFNVRKKWLWGDWVHLSMLYKTMALHNVIEIFQKCSA